MRVLLGSSLGWTYGQRLDYMGRKVPFDHPEEHRTKQSHPYSYDPILQYEGGYDEAPEGYRLSSFYTDRFYGWDPARHDRLCEKYFGNKGQYWHDRDPKQIELMLKEYLNDENVKLTKVIEWCNQATGYPCWSFTYLIKIKD